MRPARPARASLATAILVAVVAALVAPAGAASSDPRQERESVRAQRAQLARQLDTVKASDLELAEAVDALNAHIAVQARKVASARQAVAAAEAELAGYQRDLEATEARMVHLRTVLVERAVDAFVHPERDMLDELITSEDVTEAARKHTLLDQVTSNDRDVIDQLNAAAEDLADLKAAAEAAAAKALERRRQADARMAELEDANEALREKRQALHAREEELKAEIAAHARAEARLTAVIRESERRSRTIGVRGGPPSASGLIWPVRGVVTSEYGYRWGRLHAGIDVGAPTGRPISAANSGEVIYAGAMNGYGNVVVIDHGGGFTTVYAHQSRVATRDGANVSRGDVIGYVGSTGRSTGPHLHFETRVSGSPRNPRNYLP